MLICDICSSQMRVYIPTISDPITGESFSIYECIRCGLKSTYPHPDDVAVYYDDKYHGGRHGFTAAFRAMQRFKLVRKLVKTTNQKLLDIGCGDGTFINFARHNGWNVRGTELNITQALLEKGDVVRTIDELTGLEKFDAVTLWHSFEHLTDPEFDLLKIKKILNHEGVLILAVPDSGGWQARVFKHKWLHYDVPRHLYHYDFKSLEYILKKCGFKIIMTKHQEFEYDIMGWIQSALDSIMSVKRILLNYFMNKPGKVSKGEFYTNILAGGLLFIMALPLVIVGNLSGKNGTIVVVAKLRETGDVEVNANSK